MYLFIYYHGINFHDNRKQKNVGNSTKIFTVIACFRFSLNAISRNMVDHFLCQVSLSS